MPRPKFRIACCLCSKPIPRTSDAYALDKEWERRFPRMTGTIACGACALHKNGWTCLEAGDRFVDGHIPAANSSHDLDSWDHIREFGSHVAMVINHPESGLLQGAEEYLRYTARRPGVAPEVAQRLRAVLDAWDTRIR